MKWKQFYQSAYPPSFARSEADRSLIWRINRWIGLRFAYLFYHLGFSANSLSIFRLFLAFCGFVFVSRVNDGAIWQPLAGNVILAWQINLDYADGPIARVQQKSSKLGEKLDGLANAVARSAALILAGFLTNNLFLLVAGTFSAYIIVTFISSTNLKIKNTGKWQQLAFVYRCALYVPVMAFGLPLLMAIQGLMKANVIFIASVVVYVYTVLALIWLLLLLGYDEQKASVLEPIIETKSE
jgi:phosphatidylglycerophosphate synthase